MNPFRSLRDYEIFVYTLPERHASIVTSTLVVARQGARIATVTGEVIFASGHHLLVKERLTTGVGGVMLRAYGYESWLGSEKLYWYDSQPHPNDATLASTHPHHKHIPPDIKHHRITAPGLSFERPNLPFLIEEIERVVLG